MSSGDIQPGAEQSTPPAAARFTTRWILIALVAAVGGAVCCFAFSRKSEPVEQLLKRGRRALLLRDYEEAEGFAVSALVQQPDSTEALLMAGDAARRSGRPEAAITYYDRIPDDGTDEAVRARLAGGDVLLLKRKQPSDAEAQFRRAVAQQPDNAAANGRLAYVLRLGCRHFESIPYRLAAIRRGEFELAHLYVLAIGDDALEDPELIRQYRAASPEDPAPLVSLARFAMHDGDLDQAERLLRQAIRSQPKWMSAQATLGQLLRQRGADDDFLEWHSELPASAGESPRIWALRGAWAADQGDLRSAVRCFWEAVRRDPNHQQSNYQLGTALAALDEQEQAQPFLDRAAALSKYLASCFAIANAGGPGGAPLGEVQQAATQAESLGLHFDAFGWGLLAARGDRPPAWAQQTVERLRPQLADPPLVRTTPASNPAEKIDLAHYPLPIWPEAGSGPADSTQLTGRVEIRFEDEASAAGIEFTYFNSGAPLSEGRKRMYEFSGGGAAVLDYDGDGWPDLHFTQGCRWPPGDDDFEHLDRLFRNLGDGRFEDVTESARLLENRFSLGATVGDFDNDGFADLFVGNIGGNRLYQNNGDGTFSDVTPEAGVAGDRWTTSCLLADLNGDSLPDIYAVNYLSGDDVFTRICENAAGEPESCLPQNFPGAPDQFYLSAGDGQLVDISERAGISLADGKGLGIVAADLDGNGQPSLFVANDTVPNFYFVNEAQASAESPRFVNRALPTGLALNQAGQSEACMGIAAGDADGNGSIDLFVTNFEHESNTLYRQLPGGLFADRTSAAGLHVSSIRLLGFGTQFADFDLDGRLDLVIANGHIHEGASYRMPPQCYRNVGRGSFVELTPNTLGAYFEGRYLGRGLTRLDWNRDGLEDIAVSHLDAPVALLTNRTKQTGRFLSLQLRGRTSSRDAIGTTVRLQNGDQFLVRQLTAGDGYLASNERRLVFGLGKNTDAVSAEIRWPSGLRQRFTHLPADVELLVIEGRDEPYVIPRSLSD